MELCILNILCNIINIYQNITKYEMYTSCELVYLAIYYHEILMI